MLPEFSVVIPAFNEADRIGQTLSATIRYLEMESRGSEIVVVDDGSTDETSEVAADVFAAHRHILARTLKLGQNRGKGAAVREGLLAAAKPIAVFFDADLATPIEELPKIVEPVAQGEVDIAFGSRALDRGLIGRHQPARREQAGRVYNLLVRLSTGLPYWDTQCGFKAFCLETCRTILHEARIDGFGFDVELLFLARMAHLSLREIPVRWNHVGGSKVSFFRDSLRMLAEVVALRTRPIRSAPVKSTNAAR